MQKEGGLIIFAVSDRLDRDLPDMPFATIHDALVVPITAVHEVRRLCEEVASEVLGFPPYFKIEHP
jgi:hypothetical protein